MTKYVLKPSEVAHAWANQTQDEAWSRDKDGGKTINFNGLTISSYRMEIAAFRDTPTDRFVFATRESRSVTTTSHQSEALSASRQYTQFIYNWDRGYAKIQWSGENANALSGTPSSVEPIQIWEQYNSLRREVAATANEKRHARTRTARLSEAEWLADEANKLADAFSLDVPKLSSEVTAEEQAEMAAYTETKRLMAIAERKALALKLQVERDEWIAGTRHYFPQSDKLDVCLRLNPSDPDEVQTSRSATVPTKVCRRLFKAFKDQQMPDDKSVGNFRLDDVNADGLTIGCHHITATELTRFAKVLWPDEA